MTCESCIKYIKGAIDVAGLKSIDIVLASKVATVVYDPAACTINDIMNGVRKLKFRAYRGTGGKGTVGFETAADENTIHSVLGDMAGVCGVSCADGHATVTFNSHTIGASTLMATLKANGIIKHAGMSPQSSSANISALTSTSSSSSAAAAGVDGLHTPSPSPPSTPRSSPPSPSGKPKNDEFTVEGMTCESCIKYIKGAIDVKGLKSIDIALASKVASVVYDPAVTNTHEIMNGVRKLKFQVYRTTGGKNTVSFDTSADVAALHAVLGDVAGVCGVSCKDSGSATVTYSSSIVSPATIITTLHNAGIPLSNTRSSTRTVVLSVTPSLTSTTSRTAENKLTALSGVNGVNVSLSDSSVSVRYDSNVVSADAVAEVIRAMGYLVVAG